jgi:hypothetical protein
VAVVAVVEVDDAETVASIPSRQRALLGTEFFQEWRQKSQQDQI